VRLLLFLLVGVAQAQECLCVTEAPPKLGTEVAGKCTAVKQSFGCFTQVDGGRIVGRVCID
jgi:hypothetical protein